MADLVFAPALADRRVRYRAITPLTTSALDMADD